MFYDPNEPIGTGRAPGAGIELPRLLELLGPGALGLLTMYLYGYARSLSDSEDIEELLLMGAEFEEELAKRVLLSSETLQELEDLSAFQRANQRDIEEAMRADYDYLGNLLGELREAGSDIWRMGFDPG
jgi:hypothetical protein